MAHVNDFDEVILGTVCLHLIVKVFSLFHLPLALRFWRVC